MIVGVTGHQILSDFNVEWIADSINDFFLINIVLKGISSLAVGADQLFVTLLKKHGISYDVIIPCKNYESTFNNSDLINYKAFLASAKNITELSYNKPGEVAFYEAGKRVVELSDVIIAIWDGNKAKGLGGTGDIVQEAVKRSKSIVHINPVTMIVKIY